MAAQAGAQETPAAGTGTIQGTVRDSDGNPVEGARVVLHSRDTETNGQTRSAKDGTFSSEALPPGVYTVRADATDYLMAEVSVTVQVGAAAAADFRLEEINPGPARQESKIAGDVVGTLPINGRNYLSPARIEAETQVVDGAVLDPGKSGFQAISINGLWGRTTHYDIDQVESMDETHGALTLNLPSEAVSEVTIVRSTPEVYQSLNAAGAVGITTRSGGDEWHGNLFGNFRNRWAMAGFPSNSPHYSRQIYGFGAGGAVIKDKAFLFLSGERVKQDGQLPFYQGFPYNFLNMRDASDRDDMLTARLDYNLSENTKWFARLSYDNAKQFGPTDSWSKFQDQVHVPGVVLGLDWNRGRFAHSGRFGYQKLVNTINPAFGQDSLIFAQAATIHQQIGSFALGPSDAGPRQTIQRDLFGRYDGSTVYKEAHNLRFGGAIHRIAQGDFYSPGLIGPSVTSSNGLAVINAINGNPNLLPIVPGDPRGAADNPLNYPVGTFTIYNGLGNFSENSAFNRSTGGHFDTRIEGYVADKFQIFPNLNVTVGVNYVRDSGRTNSDLSATPCSAINPTIVTSLPCTGNALILDQFGLTPAIGGGTAQSLGQSVPTPNYNFAPQAGIAWDPGHNGRTVVRASGGMFFDNFLLQNAYQDRINRLSNGQYARGLTLCPTGTVLFPDSASVKDVVSSIDGLDIASQICGQPLGAQPLGPTGPTVATAIEDLQAQFTATQSATSGANVYSLANSLANFGGLLAPTYKTPRVVHMSFGLRRALGEHSSFSIDYVRQIGTQFPLGIDTNHVGDARYLTDGSDPNPANNHYGAELAAINATLAANPLSKGCLPATSTGGSSQAAVNCYLQNVAGASIVDFARQGLDSSNAFCGPFPCAVLGKNSAASFGGINPAVGSNVMFFPAGRSKYQGVTMGLKTSGTNFTRGVRHWDLAVSYTYSAYESNIASPNGSGGDYSVLPVAEDYVRPHVGHWGSSGLDRRSLLAFTPSFDLRRGPRLTMIAQMASPLPLTLYLPQQDGGGVAGEIFRTDWTGDGTVGDLLPGKMKLGSVGRYTTGNVTQAIKFYNANYAGRTTPAGNALVNAGLFSAQELAALGAVMPLVQQNAGATPTWLKTIDLHLSWPFHVGERFKIEPNVSAFNIFNLANFGDAGRQLSGILDGSPGTSINNATVAGNCGVSAAFCTSRLDRITAGSGTYGTAAPRQLEFGVRVTF